jgi:predicted ATPase
MFPLMNFVVNDRIKEVMEVMGMLKSISLENYKCFKDKTDINVAPLTVLCGVNSSGKSSILKSLLVLKQSATGNNKNFSISLSGDLVDSGNFNNVIYDGEDSASKTFKIINEFKIRNHNLASIGKYIKKSDAEAFNELRRIYTAVRGTIKEFILRVEITIEQNSINLDELTKYINDNRICEYAIFISAIDRENKIIEECASHIIIRNHNDNKHHFITWENIPGFVTSRNENSFKNYQCVCSFNGLTVSNIFAYNMPNWVKGIVPNILAISRIVSNQYTNLLYIAPLRNTPERTYIMNKDVDSVGIAGQDTPILLAKLKNKKVDTDMYCPFNNILYKDQFDYTYAEYLTIIQQWLDYFEIGKLDISGENRVLNLRLDKHNIADVGFGVSQLLPIISQGVCMNKEQTLLIEQPEIHLHPKMELQMADFLIHMAKTERQVIVETHSDHIINRIIKRAMENPSLVADTNPLIKIIFLDKENMTSTQKIDIHIDKYRGVLNGTKNFFTQFGFEQMEIAKQGYENHKRDQLK